ncbi:hypothetical protein K7432_017343 [Basidiobolus ranarum]|uniref:HAM1-like N-terminal domain-containing protein n=1 Tax=Basidiobolus ranarum TaxID=34480 RepID=A0ABR2WDI0_9FUNG
MGNALQEGKLPTTTQINQGLNKLTEDNSLHNAAANMSPAGKKVMANAERLVESTQTILAEKNSDNQLQNALYHSGLAGQTMKGGNDIQQTRSELAGQANEAGNLASEGADRISRVAWLLVTSSQFRRLINDVTNLFQEVVQSNVPGHPGQQGQTTVDPASGQSTYPQTRTDPHQANQQGNEMDPREAANTMQSTVRDAAAPTYFQAKETARPYVEQAEQGNISATDAVTGAAKEMKTGLEQKLSNVELNPEQRDHLINRMKAVLREVQGNPEFQSAVDELMDILSRLKRHGQRTSDKLQETANSKQEAGADDLEIAQANAKELVENFAGNKSLDPLLSSFKELSDRLDNDRDLSQYVEDVKTFILRSIRENEYVDRQGYTDDANRLIERAHNIAEGKYRGQFEKISREASDFNKAIQSDRTTQRFASDLEALTQSLFLDDSGNPTVRYDLIKDFAKLIPVIAQKLEYLPLPRIEQSDEKIDMVLDNVVIKCSNIAPNFVHLKTDTVLDTNPDAKQNLHNKVFIKFTHVQVEASNVAFYYKKKTFPKLSDVGYIDLNMPEDGIELDMTLDTNPAEMDKAHVYKVLDCNTRVNDLKLKIHGSKRDTTYKLLSPIINSRVKKVIEQVVPEKLIEMMTNLDNQLAIATEQALAKAQLGLKSVQC